MNTAWMLLARYEGRPIIPVEDVVRDFFSHLTPAKFIRKASAGEIRLPLIRIEGSSKCAKGVHLTDLAEYIDVQRAAAKKELAQMIGAGGSSERKTSA